MHCRPVTQGRFFSHLLYICLQHPAMDTDSYVDCLSDDILSYLFKLAVDSNPLDEEPIQVHLSQVCSRWRVIVNGFPLLWATIPILPFSKFNPFVFFERSEAALIHVIFDAHPVSTNFDLHLRTSKSIAQNIERLERLDIFVFEPEELHHLFRDWRHSRCPNFHEMRLTLSATTTSGSDGAMVEPGELLWVDGTEMRALRVETDLPHHLNLPNLPNLKTLECCSMAWDDKHTRNLLYGCPALENLFVPGGKDPQNSEYIVDDPTPTTLAITSPSLKTISIDLTDHQSSSSCNCCLPNLLAPNLENMEILFHTFLFNTHYYTILSHLCSFPSLKRLRLQCSILLEHDTSFITASPRPLKLEIVGLPQFNADTDKLFSILQTSNLKSIAIDFWIFRRTDSWHQLDFTDFAELILARRPALSIPLVLHCRKLEDEDSKIISDLAATLGKRLSIIFRPLEPWAFDTSLALYNDMTSDDYYEDRNLDDHDYHDDYDDYGYYHNSDNYDSESSDDFLPRHHKNYDYDKDYDDDDYYTYHNEY